jgi:O-antigen ligase
MDILIVIAALAALIWGTVLAVRGSLIGGCVVFLLTLTTLGHDFFNFRVGPLPLTLDRIALVGLAAAYVIQRWLGRTIPKPLTPLDGILFAFLGVLTVSMLAAGWQPPSPTEVSPLWRLIGGYLIPFAIYWVARQAPLTESQLRFVLKTLVAFGVYLAFTGICEKLELWSLVFPRFIRDPNIGLHFGRARGPMVHSVTYGVYLSAAFLALWQLLRTAPTRGQKLALASLVPLFAAGLYACLTRSVWMGAGFAALVVVAMTFPAPWRRLAFAGAFACALFLGVFKLDAIIGLQREGTVADTRTSVDMRGSFAYVSWLMFQERPLLGFGFGQFPVAKLDYLADRTSDLPLEQIRGYVHHNGYLSLLTETGLVGLGLFMAVLGGWAHRAWRLARDAAEPDWARSFGPFALGIFAVYATQLMFHELSYTPLDHSLVFFVAGLTANLTTEAALARRAARATKPSLEFSRSVAPTTS